MIRKSLTILMLFVMLCPIIFNTTLLSPSSASTIEPSTFKPISQSLLASDSGTVVDTSVYSVLELTNGGISPTGDEWSLLLNESGIVSNVITVGQILSNSSIIDSSVAILLDNSLGSENGTSVSESLLDILVKRDAPIIALGQAAWLLHRFRKTSPPSMTAPSTTSLLTSSPYEGAVFLNKPFPLVPECTLFTESMNIPVDQIQAEHSRIVNLVGTVSSNDIAPLRYDSWPLDIFLYSPSNPGLLTGSGKDLLVNILSYCTSLGESEITLNLQNQQVTNSSPFIGGFQHSHEPKLSSTYYAIQAMNSLKNNSQWIEWVSVNNHSMLEQLSSIYEEDTTEAWFLPHSSSTSFDVDSTAQGLWLVSILNLSDSFNVEKVSTYLANQQSIDGDFGNNILTTSIVLLALEQAQKLSSIDTSKAENWLRSCVIDGGKTNESKLWGGIGKNPTDLNPSNHYALALLTGLDALDTNHDDPLKLTEWITVKTGNLDGSYNNTLDSISEIVIGTACALSSLSIMGTLTTENRTAGFSWLTDNQLDSGGFGIEKHPRDVVAKVKESSLVSCSLWHIGEISTEVATKLTSFFESCKSPYGFEEMERIPSLMWSSWLSQVARYSHGWNHLDNELFASYIEVVDSWTIYPFWNNLSTLLALEYNFDQYRTKSVWTQYFGITSAIFSGLSLSSEIIGSTEAYLSTQQASSGHYRNSMMLDTPSIQYSIAAIETLHLLNSLGTIQYRSELENKILSEYSSGLWSSASWTLRPFAGCQPAIDYLSTRAAVRLEIVTSTMADEIEAVITSRIQYDDLWKLSCDVATLALLNSSGFSVNLESINCTKVLESLGSNPFSDGWYNSTELWQPVYTAQILEMVSILGIRTQLWGVKGSIISVSCSPTVDIRESIELAIAITSDIPENRLVVHAFGISRSFDDVLSTDSISIPIPQEANALGPVNISVMVVNWNKSRGFDICSVDVLGSITGNLEVHTHQVLPGQLINSTLSFYLADSIELDDCNISIKVENSTTSFDWSYIESSPFQIQTPTDELTSGSYDMIVEVSHEFCDSLLLTDTVTIEAPIATYIQTVGNLSVLIGDSATINWSLCFMSNDSFISDQKVLLSIYDDENQIVKQETMISKSTVQSFSWSPEVRGNYTYTLEFAQNGSFVSSESTSFIEVFEQTELSWKSESIAFQYDTIALTGRLTNTSGFAIPSSDIHVQVTSPISTIVIDSVYQTNSTGYITFPLSLNFNGYYLIHLEYNGEFYRTAIDLDTSLLSWTDTSVDILSFPSEGIVDSQYSITALLSDSVENPISNQPILVRITYLPSLIVYENTFVTNASGHITTDWSGSSAGSYYVEIIFSGSITYGTSNSSHQIELRLNLQISLYPETSYDVNNTGSFLIEVLDQDGYEVSNILVQIAIYNSSHQLVYETSALIESGFCDVTWTPIMRGWMNFSVTIDRQHWYESEFAWTEIAVYDTPLLSVSVSDELVAPSVINSIILVQDSNLHPIGLVSVNIEVQLDGQVIETYSNQTDSQGEIILTINVENPGVLSIFSTLTSQGYLRFRSNETQYDILGSTTLTLTTPTQPISQGTTVVIVATLLNWDSNPLVGKNIDIRVSWSNGTLIFSNIKTTSSAGKASTSYTFSVVGDYLIEVRFNGDLDNAKSESTKPQRVYITPSVYLDVTQTCYLDEPLSLSIGITDYYGSFIPGRTLLIRILEDGIVINETQVESTCDISTILWIPLNRGVISVVLLHAGDLYFYSNSTDETVTIYESISGALESDTSTVELFDSTEFTYQIIDASENESILIEFQVLGVDLIPVWIAQQLTNSSGMASVNYLADDTHGILTIRAFPVESEFLTGGTKQIQLTVRTDCSSFIGLAPFPPALGGSVNISIQVLDEFSEPLQSVRVLVSLEDPYGEPVQFGIYSTKIVYTNSEGYAIVEFTPQISGSYKISLSSDGSDTVNSFSTSEHKTIYCPTGISLHLNQSDIRVGDGIIISACLNDYFTSAIPSQNLTFILDGPGSAGFGPLDIITNSSGYAVLEVSIQAEGLWTVVVEFDGIGVYLGSLSSYEIDADYGTSILIDHDSDQQPVAEVESLFVEVQLVDDDDRVLEGFTISYFVYHEISGLVDSNSIIQDSQTPLGINISFTTMGEHTIVFSFSGTTHYHPSSNAILCWVLGTTSVNVSLPSSIDRSENRNVSIRIFDETSSPLPPSQSFMLLELIYEESSINIEDRIFWLDDTVRVNITALSIGLYTLRIIIESTNERIGLTSESSFTVTSNVTINVIDETLSGIIDEEHSITIMLHDSLDVEVPNLEVQVSIFNPNNREIFGNPLTSYTLISVEAGGYQISFTPSLSGNYSIVISFNGNLFLSSANYERTILARVQTQLSIEIFNDWEFGESVSISVNLVGGISKMKDELIFISIYRDSTFVSDYEISTSANGIGSIEIMPELSGNYVVIAKYQGTDYFAPAMIESTFQILPRLSISQTGSTGIYVGLDSTIHFEIRVVGVSTEWVGNVSIEIFDSENKKVEEKTIEINSFEIFSVSFIPESVGVYFFKFNVSTVPILTNLTHEFQFEAFTVPIYMHLDVGTVPVVSGIGIIVVFALIFTQRLNNVSVKLPSEWGYGRSRGEEKKTAISSR
ncbi:MAG: hypothetical protein GF411_12300 [Candidatus Lokiarchaeota archaeon]|nr:hypothetical protein [Candidatus Lokiarchaeota archaeon]